MYFKCSKCGREYDIKEVHYLCSVCAKNWLPGEHMEGHLEIVYTSEEQASFKSDFSIKNFFPFDKSDYPNIQIGNTPFYKSEKLSNNYKANVWVKNETVNPTGSFKDRASYIVNAQAKHFGFNEIVCASTGNAGSSLAGICASTDIKAKIFIPSNAPIAKRAQNIAYGADLTLVDGNYDDAYKISNDYSTTTKCINRNTGYNPFTIEGKKTCSLEIIEQNKFKAPQFVVVPVGDGVIISGIYKGFKDLFDCGLIKDIPKIIGIQSEKSNAIYNHWKSGNFTQLENATTIADSISVNNPACSDLAVRAIIDSKGSMLQVKDEDIKSYQLELAQSTGIFCEPSSSIVMAFLKNNLTIGSNDQVVLILTGHGLKDINSII